MKAQTQPAKNPLACIVIAAGKGTRMKSALPKVMHKVAGTSMLLHVLECARAMQAEKIVTVLAPDMQDVAAVAAKHGDVAFQNKQLGTAHAVLSAQSALAGFSGTVLILYGDMPLITPETLTKMLGKLEGPRSPSMVVLGFMHHEPGSYGRLVIDKQGKLQSIVEANEATPEQLEIPLCNAGVMAAPAPLLFSWLKKVGKDNKKGEYYLTDIVTIAREEQRSCGVAITDYGECQGVNSRDDLAQANMIFQSRLRQCALDGGATLLDPSTVYFSADTKLAQDTLVHPHVIFGSGVVVESGAEIRAFSHIEGAHIKKNAVVGPFARLRPGAVIGEDAHVGNFVEIKNSTLGRGAKANHLSYVGDATVGERANIGAGTITCNYDGKAKHKTVIGAGAFIGSNTSLVAPVTVGEGAVVGAGSTITQDVEDGALAIARAQQVTKPNRTGGKKRKKA